MCIEFPPKKKKDKIVHNKWVKIYDEMLEIVVNL